MTCKSGIKKRVHRNKIRQEAPVTEGEPEFAVLPRIRIELRPARLEQTPVTQPAESEAEARADRREVGLEAFMAYSAWSAE